MDSIGSPDLDTKSTEDDASNVDVVMIGAAVDCSILKRKRRRKGSYWIVLYSF